MARAGPEKAVRLCLGRLRLFARCDLKQLCCYINPDFSVKMSEVSEHSAFDYPEKKMEKRGGHVIKCLLTELGRARRENIWHAVMALRPYAMTLGQIFSRLALPLSQ